MVRCLNNKTAKRVQAKNPPEMIFFDADGQEIHRKQVTTQAAVEAAFLAALNKYKDEPVNWGTGSFDENARGTDEDKLVAMIFVDGRKNSKKFLKALENRWLVKHHKRITFIRNEYDKKSEICKEWRIIAAPTMILVNPKESDARKRILGKLIAKKDVRNIRSAFLKAFKKLDKLNK